MEEKKCICGNVRISVRGWSEFKHEHPWCAPLLVSYWTVNQSYCGWINTCRLHSCMVNTPLNNHHCWRSECTWREQMFTDRQMSEKQPPWPNLWISCYNCQCNVSADLNKIFDQRVISKHFNANILYILPLKHYSYVACTQNSREANMRQQQSWTNQILIHHGYTLFKKGLLCLCTDSVGLLRGWRESSGRV